MKSALQKKWSILAFGILFLAHTPAFALIPLAEDSVFKNVDFTRYYTGIIKEADSFEANIVTLYNNLSEGSKITLRFTELEDDVVEMDYSIVADSSSHWTYYLQRQASTFELAYELGILSIQTENDQGKFLESTSFFDIKSLNGLIFRDNPIKLNFVIINERGDKSFELKDLTIHKAIDTNIQSCNSPTPEMYLKDFDKTPLEMNIHEISAELDPIEPPASEKK